MINDVHAVGENNVILLMIIFRRGGGKKKNPQKNLFLFTRRIAHGAISTAAFMTSLHIIEYI